MTPVPIHCPRLTTTPPLAIPSSPPDWSGGSPGVPLLPCGPGRELPFRPATVHCAWDPSHLHLFATLEDDDIFNTATAEPAFTWMTGDVIEIFLQTGPDRNYHEFHVTPDNIQLRFFINAAVRLEILGRTPRGTRRSENPSFREWVFDSQLPPGSMDSRVHVDHAAHRWNVQIRLPHRSLGVVPPREGQEWKVLFSRFDYTRGHDQPVMSASSPQSEARPDFHDQTRWHPLVFQGA